jgi:formylglycine-generating enzyme required for sulfatase activity
MKALHKTLLTLALLGCLNLVSCAGLRRGTLPVDLEAGATRVSEKDEATLVYIPAGEFVMGSGTADSEADPDEFPQHTVYLDAFWIDQTEVTNEQYSRCVEAGACLSIVTPREDMAAQPRFPVQGVAWPEAVRYCEWVERRLPTEAEWEKAARGTGGDLYPWGNTADESPQVNIDFRVGDVNDVGTNPDDRSPYGVLDTAGNATEWVADWYDETYYSDSPAENPAGPEQGTVRVERGGGWNGRLANGRAANRFWAFPFRNDFTGFRCAQDS